MNARDRHVTGHVPDYTRQAQGFRHLDGRRPDWRHARPALQAPRHVSRWRALLRSVGQWALNQIHQDPRERRVIYNYLLIATWIVMLVIGVLAKYGVHP